MTNNAQVTDGANILLVATSLFEKLRSRTISSILKDIRGPAPSGFFPTQFSNTPLKSLTSSLIINIPPSKLPTTKSSLPLLSSSIKDRTSTAPLSLFNNNQQKHQPIPFFSNQVLFGPPIIPSIEIPVFEPINHWTTALDSDQSSQSFSRSVQHHRRTRQQRPDSSSPSFSSSSNELLLSIPFYVQEQDWPLFLLDNKSLFEQSQQHQSFRPELAESNFPTFISTIVNNNKLQLTNDGAGNRLAKKQNQQLFNKNSIGIDPNFLMPIVNYSKIGESIDKNNNLKNQFYYEPTNYKWNKTIPIEQSFIILNTSQELLETSENRNLKQNDLNSPNYSYLSNNYNRKRKPYNLYDGPDQQYFRSFSHQSKLLEAEPNHNIKNNFELSNPYSFYLNKYKNKPEQNYFQIFDIVENGVNPELVELIEFEGAPESNSLADLGKTTDSSSFLLPTNTNWPYNSRYIPVINDIINNNETVMASSNLQNNYELNPKNQTQNRGRTIINGTS